MPLATLAVPRLLAAAAVLDTLDPERRLKDDVNQALRLSAAQNGTTGTITTTPALVARVDELLADGSPSPAATPANPPPAIETDGDSDPYVPAADDPSAGLDA